MIRWFAGLPVSTVAMSAIFPGMVLGICASPEWRELGRQQLLFAIVLLILWAAARWVDGPEVGPTGDDMTEKKRDTDGQRPDPSLMSPRYTQPGRKWLPLNGPYKDKLGAEHCATSNFEWVGLMFPGETEYQVFNIDELQPAD